MGNCSYTNSRLTALTVAYRTVLSSKTSIMAAPNPTPAEFRLACGQFATGVTVITAVRGPKQVHGMTANSFTSVSLDPLLILVCIDEHAQMLPLLKKEKRFGVSILKENQQAISEYFAQPEENPKIEAQLGIHYRWTKSGIPLLENALAHLTCQVVDSHVAGDHTVFIAAVTSVEVYDGSPLVYFRGNYRSLR